MKEIKRLKFSESHKFKKKANEEQFKFNQKLIKTLDSAKSAAENPQLEKVKTSLGESETLISERQKHILLADKSDYGWVTVDKKKKAQFGRWLGSRFCKGLFRRFLLPLLEATSTAAPPTKPPFPRCTYAILPSFHVPRFDFSFSITLTISHVATDVSTFISRLVVLP